MATATQPFSARPNVRARLECWVADQEIANNRSLIGIQWIAEETAQQPSWHLDNNLGWSAAVNSVPFSGLWSYDFRPTGNQAFVVLNTTVWINHNNDGTLAVSASGSFPSADILGSASAGLSFMAPRIPRGPKVKDGGTYKNTVAYVKDAGVYKIAIPYIKDAGVYKIGGG